MADLEANKEATRRFIEGVFNDHDLSVYDELIADDFVEHEEIPGLSPDKAGSRQWFEMFYAGFPDLHVEIHDMVADGDRVAVRGTMTGTHQGDIMGIPATGRSITLRTMDIVSIRDGRATGHWGVTDQMALLMQLGVIPTPETASA